jgi:hypothetical protein
MTIDGRSWTNTGRQRQPHMLQHLIIRPTGGLGNQFRAIASAKRLCQLNVSRCTVHWMQGGHERLVAPDPNTDWVQRLPLNVRGAYTRIRFRRFREGGRISNHRLWVTREERVILQSCHVFNAFEEPHVIGIREVRPWLPLPSAEIGHKVEAFRCKYLRSNTIGMHIRRTDKTKAVVETPDHLYIHEAASLIERGYRIFLASDNKRTLDMMKTHFGDNVILYPKAVDMEIRWPRRGFNLEATIEDLTELFLLAACDFVVGSAYSTFSILAALYNGSPQCMLLKIPDISRRGVQPQHVKEGNFGGRTP